MEKFEIIIPTIFGMEAFVTRELRSLGYETTSVEDGKVTFLGDAEAVCRANLWIRTGERVLIKVAEFTAVTFDELFEGTKAADWPRWIGKKAAFPVKGFCLKSTLASVRDCQAIVKKAIADRLSREYSTDWLEESGEVYQIQFSVFKDKMTLMIDTSGDGLHKRGYRRVSNLAPLKETIAAAMVYMSHWKYEFPLADPLCGSGTIPIEAAMIKRNIAPGLGRNFAAESFPQIDANLWRAAREEAETAKKAIPLEIFASDIDAKTVEIARENAVIAGVGDAVRPKVGNVRDFASELSYGTVICNPPYGERLGDKEESERVYADMGKAFSALDKWSYYVITSNENFEDAFGRKSSKKRKIYNGMLKCNIYQYFGPRPPRIDAVPQTEKRDK